MLGSIFVGFAGMTAYSRGLNVISNNVANMNTPGFKVGDPLFTNLVYRGDGGAVSGFGSTRSNGAGVAVNTDRMSFRQGDFADQGNSLDAAIDGNGFFVLEELYPLFGIEDNSVDAMRENVIGRIFHGYDGTVYTKMRPLQWVGRGDWRPPIDVFQLLPPGQRNWYDKPLDEPDPDLD